MRLLKLLWIIPIAVILGYCSTAFYNYQVADDADFGEYETFAFLPDNDTSEFSVYNSQIVKDKTMRSIQDEMTDRGFSLNNEDPDLLIYLHYLFSRGTEMVYDPVSPSYSYYIPGLIITPWNTFYYVDYATVPRIDGNGLREVQYTEGTIAVDVIDAETNKLLWRGWSEDRIDPQSFTKDVQKYIENIFKNFPVEERI